LKGSIREHWSHGVLKKDIKPLAVTPTCPGEVTPRITETDIPKSFEIKIFRQKSPFFGSKDRKFSGSA
jgi:hypothetical protein